MFSYISPEKRVPADHPLRPQDRRPDSEGDVAEVSEAVLRRRASLDCPGAIVEIVAAADLLFGTQRTHADRGSRAEFTCKIGERRELQRRIGYEDSQKDYGGDSIRDIARDCAGERVFRGTLSRARGVLSQNGSHR